MKKILFSALCIAFLFCFSVEARASEEIYSSITDALGKDALSLLEEFGFSELASGEVTEITPLRALKTLSGIFSGALTEPVRTAGIVLGLLFVIIIISIK